MNFEIVTRPVRVGWCVRGDDPEHFRRAVRLTHTAWGGRFNPLLPVDDLELSSRLVDLFAVDILYPVTDDKELVSFAESFPNLPWPFHHDKLFIGREDGQAWPELLDVSHPLFLLQARLAGAEGFTQRLIPSFDDQDDLGEVLLATYGGYPSEALGRDYEQGFREILKGEVLSIPLGATIPPVLRSAITPATATSYALEHDYLGSWRCPGLYVGQASNLADLITYWNLRATGIDLLFYDPAHHHRLESLVLSYLHDLIDTFPQREEWYRRVSVWQLDKSVELGGALGDFPALHCTASKTIWNGLNVQATAAKIAREVVLGVEARGTEVSSVSMAMPPKPWLRPGRRAPGQHVVFTFRPFVAPKSDDVTYHPFNIPALNEYYGRECSFIWNTARLTRQGLGIINNVGLSHETLHALDPRALIQRVFGAFGMDAQPSRPGLVAQRLIRQMGGVQGCRVFKIRGVRKLIQAYSPLESFTRGGALGLIGDVDPATKRIRFEDYESLFIEKREKGKLTPAQVFTYLLSKRVFRVGLLLQCPTCDLDFWLALDDAKSVTECQYCGTTFDVAPQLRDRDWRYRRSGLFGREDHQQGAIPVALTLQQLDTTLHYDSMVYTTSLNVSSQGKVVESCEVDFVIMGQDHDGRVHIGLGEAKSSMEISEDDVRHLSLVADAFDNSNVDSYLIFAKTGNFSDVEVARCERGQSRYRRRVILLSQRELEPYFVYEKVEVAGSRSLYGGTLKSMAEAAQATYFSHPVEPAAHPPQPAPTEELPSG